MLRCTQLILSFHLTVFDIFFYSLSLILCFVSFVNCFVWFFVCLARIRACAAVWQSLAKVYLFYTITACSLLASFMFVRWWEVLEVYQTGLVHIRSSALSSLMLLTVLLVSSCVILNSIDYLSMVDSHLFLSYILLFQFTMLGFIVAADLVVSFLYWELLGIISYALVNFWSARINCGIKALIFNKVGDCGFVLLLSLAFSYISFTGYCAPASFSFVFSLFFSSLLSCSKGATAFHLALIAICFTKSAQLPFSS